MSAKTGATPEQLATAVRKWAASGPVYFLGDACQNSRWVVERVAAMLVPPGYKIVKEDSMSDVDRR